MNYDIMVLIGEVPYCLVSINCCTYVHGHIDIWHFNTSCHVLKIRQIFLNFANFCCYRKKECLACFFSVSEFSARSSIL